MPYEIRLKRSAEKELEHLSQIVRERIVRRLLLLESNPRSPGVKKLQGGDGYRLRVGDYRILFTIDDRKRNVEVIAIGHRRDVYR